MNLSARACGASKRAPAGLEKLVVGQVAGDPSIHEFAGFRQECAALDLGVCDRDVDGVLPG